MILMEHSLSTMEDRSVMMEPRHDNAINSSLDEVVVPCVNNVSSASSVSSTSSASTITTASSLSSTCSLVGLLGDIALPSQSSSSSPSNPTSPPIRSLRNKPKKTKADTAGQTKEASEPAAATTPLLSTNQTAATTIWDSTHKRIARTNRNSQQDPPTEQAPPAAGVGGKSSRSNNSSSNRRRVTPSPRRQWQQNHISTIATTTPTGLLPSPAADDGLNHSSVGTEAVRACTPLMRIPAPNTPTFSSCKSVEPSNNHNEDRTSTTTKRSKLVAALTPVSKVYNNNSALSSVPASSSAWPHSQPIKEEDGEVSGHAPPANNNSDDSDKTATAEAAHVVAVALEALSEAHQLVAQAAHITTTNAAAAALPETTGTSSAGISTPSPAATTVVTAPAEMAANRAQLTIRPNASAASNTAFYVALLQAMAAALTRTAAECHDVVARNAALQQTVYTLSRDGLIAQERYDKLLVKHERLQLQLQAVTYMSSANEHDDEDHDIDTADRHEGVGDATHGDATNSDDGDNKNHQQYHSSLKDASESNKSPARLHRRPRHDLARSALLLQHYAAQQREQLHNSNDHTQSLPPELVHVVVQSDGTQQLRRSHGSTDGHDMLSPDGSMVDFMAENLSSRPHQHEQPRHNRSNRSSSTSKMAPPSPEMWSSPPSKAVRRRRSSSSASATSSSSTVSLTSTSSSSPLESASSWDDYTDSPRPEVSPTATVTTAKACRDDSHKHDQRHSSTTVAPSSELIPPPPLFHALETGDIPLSLQGTRRCSLRNRDLELNSPESGTAQNYHRPAKAHVDRMTTMTNESERGTLTGRSPVAQEQLSSARNGRFFDEQDVDAFYSRSFIDILLEEYHDRLDLFHPSQAAFYQVLIERDAAVQKSQELRQQIQLQATENARLASRLRKSQALAELAYAADTDVIVTATTAETNATSSSSVSSSSSSVIGQQRRRRKRVVPTTMVATNISSLSSSSNDRPTQPLPALDTLNDAIATTTRIDDVRALPLQTTDAPQLISSTDSSTSSPVRVRNVGSINNNNNNMSMSATSLDCSTVTTHQNSGITATTAKRGKSYPHKEMVVDLSNKQQVAGHASFSNNKIRNMHKPSAQHYQQQPHHVMMLNDDAYYQSIMSSSSSSNNNNCNNDRIDSAPRVVVGVANTDGCNLVVGIASSRGGGGGGNNGASRCGPAAVCI